jgi:hypothetical protein
VLRIDNYGTENRKAELPILNGVVTSYQNYYEFSVVSTGKFLFDRRGKAGGTQTTCRGKNKNKK